MIILTTIALLLVLALRTPLRRACGAAVAYQAWLIVPLVTVVAALPIRSMPLIQTVPALRQARMLVTRIAPPAATQIDWLLALWAAGAVALASWFVYSYVHFLRSARPLQHVGGICFSAGGAGPASMGLLRPIIVVPHDFRQRYSTDEQALILAHEQVHIVRRDALANLLQAAFQCLFWFNPLVHLAAVRFRQDQELACDAAVMARYPQRRRTYAEALLKSHVKNSPLSGAIHCHWQTSHPTKERLMQLQSTPPHPSRRLAGRCLLGLCAAGALFAALAVQAGQPAATYSVALTIDAGSVHSAPRVLAKDGQQFAVATGPWRVETTVRAAKSAGDVWIASKIYKHQKIVGTPTVLAHVGASVGVKVDDDDGQLALLMVVVQAP
jgi:bla regulator protein BlaR1